MPIADTVRAHVIVHGRVQGVFFRASTAEEAVSLGLSGWVRNAGDDVEAEFEGPRALVERMIEWCRQGPPHARVDGVSVNWGEPLGIPGFGVRY